MRQSDIAAIVLSSAVLVAGWLGPATAAIKEYPGDGQRRWCTGQLRVCLAGCRGQGPSETVTCQANCAVQSTSCYPSDPTDAALAKKPKPLKPVLHGPVTPHPILTPIDNRPILKRNKH